MGKYYITEETEKHHKKDFNDVTFAFDEVKKKMQIMWGNILSLKKLKKHQRKRHVQEINLDLLC